jgi:hypothetical protein
MNLLTLKRAPLPNGALFFFKTAFFVGLLCFLLTSSFAQIQSRTYLGLYFTGDGAMEYIGPSFMLGSDFQVTKKTTISPYVHHFATRNSWGKLTAWTLAVLYQRNFGKGEIKRMYFGIGPAAQHRIKFNEYHPEGEEHTYITLAYRLGYAFHFKDVVMCTELSPTGPYSYRGSSVYNGQKHGWSVTESLTFPSVGFRFILK